jgi:hypothetical protein
MLENPIVAPFLADHFGLGRVVTLEALLDELELFGTVTLTSAATHGQPEVSTARRHLCAVRAPNWSTTSLSGDGSSRLLAALRCLMEVLAETTRQARRGFDDFDSFLRDQ